MPVEPGEDFARAICSDKWDEATGEISASLFKGENISLSRLAICPLEESWDLFRLRVERPPARTLRRIGTMNVGRLRQVGEEYAARPTALTVEPDPLPEFPSHAVIPQKISRGLANAIIRRLTVHQEAIS